MKHLILTIFSLLFSSPAVLHAADAPASKPARITVSPETPVVAIPADFLGFSVEKKILSIKCFEPNNSVLRNLFVNLGTGVLRVGANEVDSTFFTREAALCNNNSPGNMQALGYSTEPLYIGTKSLKNLYEFSQQIGWSVIHGLNLGSGTAEMAADEVLYALYAGSLAGGQSVLAFEVGNEPNLYPKKINSEGITTREGLRPEDYNKDAYLDEIRVFYDLILEKKPSAPLCGPATARYDTGNKWLAAFISLSVISDTGPKTYPSQINLVTSHFYPLTGSLTTDDGPNKMFPSIENLLLPQSVKESFWKPKLDAAKAAGKPYRIDEYNSCTEGGKSGVSDVFASALWNLDFMFAVAKEGGAGVNLHSGFKAEADYSAFSYKNNRFYVNPIYYSMLLFKQAAQGSMVTVNCTTDANFVAYAVLSDDHQYLRVVLINKDLNNTVVATIESGLQSTNAKVIRLEGSGTSPALSKEGVKLAGSEVAENGTWVPQPGTAVSGVNGKFVVSLPPASAALLTVESIVFASWQAQKFNAAERANVVISGPTADPDNDGVSNLLEYAFGLEPKTVNTNNVKPQVGTVKIDGVDYLTLKYRRLVPALLDLTYTPQATGDLKGVWDATPVRLSGEANGDGTETVTYRDATPLVGATKRFLRLKVTLQP